MKHQLKNPFTPAPGEGVTERIYLSADQKRAWNWAASKTGVSIHDFARRGGDQLLRKIVADLIARGGNPPQNIAEFLAQKI